MSGIRSIHRNPTVKGVATDASAPFYVDSDDNKAKMIPAGTGTTEVTLIDSNDATIIAAVVGVTGGYKLARGTGAFVTGAVVIATGLASVVAFTATLDSTGTRATGATEINTINIASIATGAVSLVGSYNGATGATIISASGTSTFKWIAVGT